MASIGHFRGACGLTQVHKAHQLAQAAKLDLVYHFGVLLPTHTHIDPHFPIP